MTSLWAIYNTWGPKSNDSCAYETQQRTQIGGEGFVTTGRYWSYAATSRGTRMGSILASLEETQPANTLILHF